jgi:hypothetical protein
MAIKYIYEKTFKAEGFFDEKLTVEGFFNKNFTSGGGTSPPSTDVFIMGLHKIETGMVAITAAGLGGVLEE